MLADSGYVRRGPGRGTYVREKEKEGTKGGKGGYRLIVRFSYGNRKAPFWRLQGRR